MFIQNIKDGVTKTTTPQLQWETNIPPLSPP